MINISERLEIYLNDISKKISMGTRRAVSTFIKPGFLPGLLGLLAFSSSSFLAPPVHGASNWGDGPVWSTGNQGQANYSNPNSRQKQLPVAPFAPGSNNLSINLGQTFLMGDLSNSYDDSIGFKVNYTYGVSDVFGFETSAGYSGHSEGKFSMMSLLFGLRTNLAWYDKIVPYLSFGLGFYRPSYTFTGTTAQGGRETASVAPMLFGLHLGPGINLELSKNIFFGTSLTFHDIFGTETLKPNGEKLQAGGTFTSLLIHAGMTF